MELGQRSVGLHCERNTSLPNSLAVSIALSSLDNRKIYRCAKFSVKRRRRGMIHGHGLDVYLFSGFLMQLAACCRFLPEFGWLLKGEDYLE